MVNKPQIKSDELYQLLREGKVDEFNARGAAGEHCDLTGCDFRGLDLRGLNADGLDLSDGYFRQTDLRAVDLRNTHMEGASIHGAMISGAYFPKALLSDEIYLSLAHGIRMRYSD